MDSTKKGLITLVIPCFNEADNLPEFFLRVSAAFAKLPEYSHEMIFVDDGSSDSTLAELCQQAGRVPNITVLELSRNFGKEAALSAGIDAAAGDAVIPIDADLQHPPELIIDMIRKWEGGSDVVLARRTSRDTDPFFQKTVTNGFYRLHNRISDCKIPHDVGDFRLMDRRVVDALKMLPERRRFMKGLFAWVGFKQSVVEFNVAPRGAGNTSFNSRRLWHLAIEGITSFSTVPLSLWTFLGLTIAILAIIYGSWIILKTLAFGIDVPGYASLLVAVLFLGGIQLVGIGILGEYIGRIYSETKRRPVYIVRKRHKQANEDNSNTEYSDSRVFENS